MNRMLASRRIVSDPIWGGPKHLARRRMGTWLEYNSVALAVLAFGIAIVELLAFGIFEVNASTTASSAACRSCTTRRLR